MTPDRLRHRVTQGDTITKGRASLRLDPDTQTFRMDGPSGPHTLQRNETDAARLYAHWAGYIRTTKERFGQ